MDHRLIVPADDPASVAVIAALFAEYAGTLEVDLAFQGFEEELATLPGAYAPPGGRLLLGLDDGLLAVRAIAEARLARYDRIRLDTLPSMAGARRLYTELGFVAIPPYRHNPVPGTAFLELNLAGAQG